MVYQQISGATDWFYVFQDASGGPCVMPIAAFAIAEDGSAVGLVSASGSGLVKPPPGTNGMYLLRDQLTGEELMALKNKR